MYKHLSPKHILNGGSTAYLVKWCCDITTEHTGWCTKCHNIDCTYNTFLLWQKHLTSGTELILTGWKIAPNEEHVPCDHRFDSQSLANKPLHSSQLFDTSLQKAWGTTSLCGPWAALHFLTSFETLSLSRIPIKRNHYEATTICHPNDVQETDVTSHKD